MVMVSPALNDAYWQTFQLDDGDIEHLYNTLLEQETPLAPEDVLQLVVEQRIVREIEAMNKERQSAGEMYLPKNEYKVGQALVFPVFDWKKGTVTAVRPGNNPDHGEFQVIQVSMEGGEVRQLAAGLSEHALNQDPIDSGEDGAFNPAMIIEQFRDELLDAVEDGLRGNAEFVQIAGKWFPIALLVDINIGHLNLAEAVLDMNNGGPLPTTALLEQLDMSSYPNQNLLEFSFDHALEQDERFDEVGPAGQTLWFLRRLEPDEVRETPVHLRYEPISYDRGELSPDMLALERALEDELSPFAGKVDRPGPDGVKATLIFPHLASGTLPLSPRMAYLFPTAYEAPRIQITLVDGDTGDRFQGWVVRKERYVFGLKEWYQKRGLGPGSIVKIRRGEKPGEMIIQAGARRSSRDWMRTVIIGVDGGMVFTMLRQIVQAEYDERMAFAITDEDALGQLWQKTPRQYSTLEKVVMTMARELTRLNPQGHAHASEVYAAVNLIKRCPPGPILAQLATRSEFHHVGDLHFRFVDSAED